MLPPPGVRQRNLWVTGSHATSIARCPPGGTGPMGAGGGSVGRVCGGGSTPRPRPMPRLPRIMPMLRSPGLYVKFGSRAKVLVLLVDVGISTKAVGGLHDL